MSRAIHGTVGCGGNNHPHDVTSVQLLLNMLATSKTTSCASTAYVVRAPSPP